MGVWVPIMERGLSLSGGCTHQLLHHRLQLTGKDLVAGRPKMQMAIGVERGLQCAFGVGEILPKVEDVDLRVAASRREIVVFYKGRTGSAAGG